METTSLELHILQHFCLQGLEASLHIYLRLTAPLQLSLEICNHSGNLVTQADEAGHVWTYAITPTSWTTLREVLHIPEDIPHLTPSFLPFTGTIRGQKIFTQASAVSSHQPKKHRIKNNKGCTFRLQSQFSVRH